METKSYVLAFALMNLRYILVAGGAYYLFYHLKRQEWFHKKIQPLFPNQKQIHRELLYSFLSIAIFFFLAILILIAKNQGITKIYPSIKNYGHLYYFVSIALLLLWHDAYFYVIHRILHLPPFSKYHRIHHLSSNTTPLTSFSFHPIEALIQGGFLVIVFILPLHMSVVGIGMIIQTLFNVLGHLGFELIPEKLRQTFVGKFINSSTNHNIHHQYSKSNYGLYFTFWDKIFRTSVQNFERKI